MRMVPRRACVREWYTAFRLVRDIGMCTTALLLRCTDEPWMCQGQEDQVGLRVGAHKQCPDPMEAEKRARRRREEAEQEEAEQAQLRAAVSEARKAGLSAADADALANKQLGMCSYVAFSCRHRAIHDNSVRTGCVSWRQTGGCTPEVSLASCTSHLARTRFSYSVLFFSFVFISACRVLAKPRPTSPATNQLRPIARGTVSAPTMSRLQARLDYDMCI